MILKFFYNGGKYKYAEEQLIIDTEKKTTARGFYLFSYGLAVQVKRRADLDTLEEIAKRDFSEGEARG